MNTKNKNYKDFILNENYVFILKLVEWNGNRHNLFFWLSLSGEFLEEIIFKLIISETFFGVIFGVG